jgi:poly(3-hydroxybutyrate) depolymerase
MRSGLAVSLLAAMLLVVSACSSVSATGATANGTGGTPTAEPPADALSYSGTFPSSTGYASLEVGGKTRRVYVYVPQNHAAKPPLIVAFHGTGSNVSDDAHDAAMGELAVRELADANGIVVVAPFSTSDGGVNADHESGGDGWRFDGDANTNGDLALTRASIQEARRVFSVDATHIYTVGHSNGAFFAYFAAMGLSNLVAAFAENAGGLIACGQRIDCAFASAGATTCSTLLASAPSACTCAIGANPFPVAKPSGRVPQGFLKHNADDSTVSAVYSCRLAEHLGARATMTLDATGEHGVTNDFMQKAWTFLAARSLAD